MSKLLREYCNLNYDRSAITEARDEKKPVIVKALLQRADATNQNGRVYPRRILDREVENYKRAIEEGRATGECDHPETSVVNLQNVSHIMRDIWWEGDNVMGSLEVLNTPKGLIALELLSAGVKLGISSRGVGETRKDENGNDVVEEDFMLVAFDLVSEPSTHEAWLMREGKEVSADTIRRSIPKTDRISRLAKEILEGK